MKLSLCIVLGSLLLPATAFAQGEPAAVVVVPAPNVVVSAGDGDDVTDRWNAPVFSSGAVLFAGTYIASVVVASQSSHQGDNRLYVPVLGPWLDLGTRGSCDVTLSSCDNETTYKVLLVADGLFQAVGVLGVLDGFLMPHHHRRDAIIADYQVVPTSVGHGEPAPGLAVIGSF